MKNQEAATEFPHPDVGGPVLPREQRGHILPSLPSFFFSFSVPPGPPSSLFFARTIGAAVKQCKEERPGVCAVAIRGGGSEVLRGEDW